MPIIEEAKDLLNMIPDAVSWYAEQVHDAIREAAEIVYGASDTDSM